MSSILNSFAKTPQNQTHSWLALGTIVHIHVPSGESTRSVQLAMKQAMKAIHAVEEACSRFDADSELVHLLQTPVGREVAVSPILFQSLYFACEVASLTDGRFDPTVGSRMEELGFRSHYLTGETVPWQTEASKTATFRDIELNAQKQMVRLHRPLRLDLGAVAKGLAVDLAVKELSAFDFMGFVVDAGGDLYAAGTNGDGQPWTIGIRDPVHHDQSIRTLQGQNIAVCTSGTYERRSPVDENSHHLVHPHDKQSAQGFLSMTALGPYTMLADAFSTAAFFSPPSEALGLLEEAGLEGMLITENLEIQMTSGMEGYLSESV